MDKKHVELLVVDDSSIDRMYLQLLVRSGKFEVTVVEYGEPQLAADAIVAQGWPEILLVDIRMPLMTGFELLDYLQEHAAAKPAHCQVYVYSSSSRIEDRDHAINHLLVNDFIEKPVRKEHIAQMLAQAAIK